MKISARNQFRGKVAGVATGAVNAEVRVALSGGEQLALAESVEATAIIKAPQVVLGMPA